MGCNLPCDKLLTCFAKTFLERFLFVRIIQVEIDLRRLALSCVNECQQRRIRECALHKTTEMQRCLTN